MIDKESQTYKYKKPNERLGGVGERTLNNKIIYKFKCSEKIKIGKKNGAGELVFYGVYTQE